MTKDVKYFNKGENIKISGAIPKTWKGFKQILLAEFTLIFIGINLVLPIIIFIKWSIFIGLLTLIINYGLLYLLYNLNDWWKKDLLKTYAKEFNYKLIKDIALKSKKRN
jgi:hypothetical protein